MPARGFELLNDHPLTDWPSPTVRSVCSSGVAPHQVRGLLATDMSRQCSSMVQANLHPSRYHAVSTGPLVAGRSLHSCLTGRACISIIEHARPGPMHALATLIQNNCSSTLIPTPRLALVRVGRFWSARLMASASHLRLGHSPTWQLPRQSHLPHLQLGNPGVRVPSSCRWAVSRRNTVTTATSAAGSLNALLRHPALRPRLWRRMLQLADGQRAEGQATAHHGGPSGTIAPVTADAQPLQSSLQWVDGRSAEPGLTRSGPRDREVLHPPHFLH